MTTTTEVFEDGAWRPAVNLKPGHLYTVRARRRSLVWLPAVSLPLLKQCPLPTMKNGAP